MRAGDADGGGGGAAEFVDDTVVSAGCSWLPLGRGARNPFVVVMVRRILLSIAMSNGNKIDKESGQRVSA